MGSRRALTTRVPVLLLAGVLGAAAAWAGDGSLEPYAQGAGQYVVDFDLDLIVARATDVQDARATVADPPRVQLLVETVLRGKLRPGTLPARWVPFLNAPVHRGRETLSESEAWRHYLATPLKGPKVGERLVLAGYWNPEDKRWAVSEMVRFACTPEVLADVTDDVKQAEDAILAHAESEKPRIERTIAAGRKARASADVRRLCESSTDVVLGTLERDRIRVTERLWSMPQDRWSAAADSVAGLARGHTAATERVVFTAADEPMRNARSTSGMPSNAPLVMFLRRGPYDASIGVRRYRLADHDNGLLPADSVTLVSVRKALANSSLRAQRAPEPDRDCGVPLARFVGLRREEQARVRVKITAVRIERRSHAQTFVFGQGAQAGDVEGFTPCEVPGEMVWNDYAAQPYAFSPTPEQMNQLLRALQRTVRSRKVERGEAAAALLSVHGPIDGRDRVFEAQLGSGQLDQVAAAMAAAVRDDPHLAWHLNNFKHVFGTTLAADPDWKLP